jgi:hypothetical protein
MRQFSGKDGKTNLVALNNPTLTFNASILYLFILRLKIIDGLVFLFFMNHPGYPFPLCPVECLSPMKQPYGFFPIISYQGGFHESKSG